MPVHDPQPKGTVLSTSLLDAEAIHRSLANRYADGINRASFDDVGLCWAPHGVWRVPEPFNILRSSRQEIVEHLVDRRRTVELVVMTVCSTVVIEHGDARIVARTTIEETGLRDEDRGIHVFGLYEDELAKTGGEWFFENRTLHILGADNTPYAWESHPKRSALIEPPTLGA
jgi:SnoaL-like domain